MPTLHPYDMGHFTKFFYARNCMTYADLYREVHVSKPHTPYVGVDGVEGLFTISRSGKKIMFANPALFLGARVDD